MAGRSTLALAVVLFIALAFTLPALALDPPIIDGKYDDWADKPQAKDPGGPDDERSPSRADITQASAFADDHGLYLLMGWDDAEFGGGNATTAGSTLHVPSGQHYRVYATAMDAGVVPTTTIELHSCTTSSCSSQTLLCSGAACAGMQAASSPPTLTDPFAGRSDPDCTGVECDYVDTAVELFIPWTLVGGVPSEGRATFFDFGSYPSGPANGPKDSLGPYGITCTIEPGAYTCFVSNPSAVEAAGGRVGAETDYWAPAALAGGLLLLICLAVVWRRTH